MQLIRLPQLKPKYPLAPPMLSLIIILFSSSTEFHIGFFDEVIESENWVNFEIVSALYVLMYWILSILFFRINCQSLKLSVSAYIKFCAWCRGAVDNKIIYLTFRLLLPNFIAGHKIFIHALEFSSIETPTQFFFSTDFDCTYFHITYDFI